MLLWEEIQYIAYILRVFNFANFANLESFAKFSKNLRACATAHDDRERADIQRWMDSKSPCKHGAHGPLFLFRRKACCVIRTNESVRDGRRWIRARDFDARI